MSLTDQTLLNEIQTQLLEPADGGQSWASGLWTHDEVVSLLNHRQLRFLKECLCVVKTSSPNLTVNIGDHRIALPADCVRPVTIVWRGGDGTVRELLPSDQFASDHGLATWETANATFPEVYHEWDPLTLQVEIAPAPSVAGVLEVLYVPTGTSLTGNNVALILPDEAAHGVKWGTISDQLRKDGRGRDLTRAAYAESRYELVKTAIDLILRGWA